ncbi:MAG: hypothetical protein COA49_04110 [Bacteroidetes bacterium]|nr:MAG: hypothetical protein COA49_04110 [Bacteroidota bacterium]
MKHFYLTILSISLSLLILSGCGDSESVLEINRAIDKVHLAQTSVSAFPTDSINSVRARLSQAKEEFKWLALDSNVVFVQSDAKIVGDLALASRYLKDVPSRISGLKNEIERCRSQLKGLREVIELEITIDANGDTINAKYLNENLQIELDAVKNLDLVLLETSRLIRLGLSTDSSSWDAIDSLITVKKGMWARGVSEQELISEK